MLEIISDFDGTVTSLEKAGEQYISTFSFLVMKQYGLPTSEWEQAVEKAKLEIVTNPAIYGWENNGFIVAPATSDPFVFITAACQIALEKFGKKLLSEDGSRIHSLSYQKAETCFQKGAKQYLLDLQKHSTLAIVTNSKTQDVEAKLQMLLGENNIKVIGNAYKYRIDHSWEDVPVSNQPANFPRPVLLRRKFYNDILAQFQKPSVVIGDIYELDLALPEYKGIQTALFLSTFTPSWEREYYTKHRNGFSSNSLEEIASIVLSR